MAIAITLFIVGWDYCIRLAFNLGSPLVGYTDVDELAKATQIYLGVLGIMAILMAMLGQFTAYVFDLPELLPMWTLLPVSRRTPLSFKSKKRAGGEEGEDFTSEVNFENETGLERNGILNIPKPTRHIVVCTILFLFTVVAPSIIYSMVMDNYKIAGLVCIVIIPAIGYTLLGIFKYYMGDLLLDGSTKSNVKAYNSFNSEAIRSGKLETLTLSKTDEKETKERVLLNVLIIGIIHVASNLVLGLVRYFQDDIDWNWITAAVIGGIVLFFSIVVAVYFAYMTYAKDQDYPDRSRKRKGRGAAVEEEVETTSETEETVESSDATTTQGIYGASGFSTNTRRPHSALNGILLGDMTSQK
jgi:uncharacterized membrane-anchored protein